MDKQFLMFAVNNDLTLFVSPEINDGSEKNYGNGSKSAW
jgi:hypothetical protein